MFRPPGREHAPSKNNRICVRFNRGAQMCVDFPHLSKLCRLLADMNVNVEVDNGYATLLALVRSAFMPRTVSRRSVAHICKFEALPRAAGWQLSAAGLSTKLPDKHGFRAVFVTTDDYWTQFAPATAVNADYLLLGEDGIAEKGVRRRWHAFLTPPPRSFLRFASACPPSPARLQKLVRCSCAAPSRYLPADPRRRFRRRRRRLRGRGRSPSPRS